MQAKQTTASEVLVEQVDIAIIGTGFAGLGMAVKLKEAGIANFVILEKAGDVGGTWRDNHYPGCACDVQSHLYSFSFAQNPNWSRMFSPQPEIWAYLRGVADQHGLRPHIRFNNELAEARWDEATSLWQLRSADGRRYAVRVLISGMGGLSRASFPKDIPGLDGFKGRMFHSQQWEHDFDFAGKRVAVIGTGASAIQFVPQLQKKAARVDLYQRTPPWVMPKPDRAISGFEHQLFKALPFTQSLFRAGIYAMLEARVLGFAVNPKLMKLIETVARKHINKYIKDPVLRRKLTPDYTIGCKRVLVSNDYYPALAQANVDVLTDGIREVRAHSVVDQTGAEREVDAIIFGTGFAAADPIPTGLIFGKGGTDLLDAWKDGPEAYKGTTVAGFPNLFLIVGPNTGLGHSSMVYMIESQVAYVLDALRQMKARGTRVLEVKPQAQAEFNAALQKKAVGAIWSVGGCKSWYLHPKTGKNVTLWPGATWQFRRQLARFDAQAYQIES
ncbi:MAG: NAD(P)/FAD-dependent oxidoreductase [Stagnimonas sp.]|nr:NAD(P)/FAD-dependent oxidoreductase [Stagnimonas sp.]